ncbi:MAG: hypothetical protein JXA10_14715 [Anaerolineae bacterium]|nr:hypothetical protein [Anaerolineae bacterium]
MYASTKRQNPFTVGMPIEQPDYFVGRTYELNRIISRLKKDLMENTEIVGMYRVGKTSLLRQLRHTDVMKAHGLTPQNGFLGVYLNMQEFPGRSPHEFWGRLVEEIADTIMTMGRAVGPEMRPIQQLSQEEYERVAKDKSRANESFERILRAMERQHVRFYLLCDEFDEVLQNKAMDLTFFNELRSHLGKASFAMVTASRRPLLDLTHSKDLHGSPFFNVFVKLLLGSFTPEDQDEFFQRYEGYMGVPFTTDERHFIFEYGGRFPYYMQLIGDIITHTYAELPDTTTPENRRVEIRNQFNQLAAPQFESMWQSLQKQEQDILLQLTGEPLASHTLAWFEESFHIGQKLLNMGLLLKFENLGAAIFSRGFEEWIKNYHKPEAGPVLPRIMPAASSRTERNPFLFLLIAKDTVKALSSKKDEATIDLPASGINDAFQALKQVQQAQQIALLENIPLGNTLHQIIFAPEIQRVLDHLVETTTQQAWTLGLVITEPRLAMLPWELMQRPGDGWQPAATERMGFVRYGSEKIEGKPPAAHRLLILAGTPGYEMQVQALSAHIPAIMAVNDIRQLPQAIQNFKPTLVHIIGPIIAQQKAPALHLTRSGGEAITVSMPQLRQVLDRALSQAQTPCHLVTFGNQIADPMLGLQFAGMMLPHILTPQIQGVLGLQFPMHPMAEQTFFTALFEAIKDGAPLPIAANHGRHTLASPGPGEVIWAAPVLVLPAKG